MSTDFRTVHWLFHTYCFGRGTAWLTSFVTLEPFSHIVASIWWQFRSMLPKTTKIQILKHFIWVWAFKEVLLDVRKGFLLPKFYACANLLNLFQNWTITFQEQKMEVLQNPLKYQIVFMPNRATIFACVYSAVYYFLKCNFIFSNLVFQIKEK